MIATLTTSSGFIESAELPNDESGFWKEASNWVLGNIECPNNGDEPAWADINCDEYGHARVTVQARGTFTKPDGSMNPSPIANIVENDIELSASNYTDRFLVHCSPKSTGGHGSYKYYRLHAQAGQFTARYGRVGGGLTGLFGGSAGQSRETRPISSASFWLKYAEKLAKGYVDFTDVYLPSDRADMLATGLTELEVEFLAKNDINSLAELYHAEDMSENKIQTKLEAFGLPCVVHKDVEADKSDELEASRELYRLLQDQSSAVIESILDIGSTKPSPSMIAASRELISKLETCETTKAANAVMSKLMCVSPRRADRVASFMLNDVSDIPFAIERETALVDSLLAKVIKDMGGKPKSLMGPAFDTLGIAVREANEDEKAMIFELMLDPYSKSDDKGFINRVEHIWKIDPTARLNRFEAYEESKKIEEERLLFHGSSFGSWFSCVSTGLSLAYAGKTGSNLGRGHYFANQFDKSTGYIDGGRWVGGRARSLGYIGVYRVAYGKPYMTRYCEGFDKPPDGYDCVHALSKKAFDLPNTPKIAKVPNKRGFINDEIVVYDDDACVIQYLIEYRC